MRYTACRGKNGGKENIDRSHSISKERVLNAINNQSNATISLHMRRIWLEKKIHASQPPNSNNKCVMNTLNFCIL